VSECKPLPPVCGAPPLASSCSVTEGNVLRGSIFGAEAKAWDHALMSLRSTTERRDMRGYTREPDDTLVTGESDRQQGERRNRSPREMAILE